MAEWRDISTAPRDGTPVQLYRPRATVGVWDQRIVAVWYDPDGDGGAWFWPSTPTHDGWWDDIETVFLYDNPYEAADGFTHWQPLPPAPEGK